MALDSSPILVHDACRGSRRVQVQAHARVTRARWMRRVPSPGTIRSEGRLNLLRRERSDFRRDQKNPGDDHGHA
jgi:hypothetical protein